MKQYLAVPRLKMREERCSPGSLVSRNIWDIQEAVNSGTMRWRKQKFLPRSLTAGTCAHTDLGGVSDCPGNICGRFLTMPGPTLRGKASKEGPQQGWDRSVCS